MIVKGEPIFFKEQDRTVSCGHSSPFIPSVGLHLASKAWSVQQPGRAGTSWLPGAAQWQDTNEQEIADGAAHPGGVTQRVAKWLFSRAPEDALYV